MKNIHILITLLLVSISLIACRQVPDKSPNIESITISDAEALGPYFTKDNKGNPVLCWTELNSQDSLYRLKYAIYDVQLNKFGKPITVLGSEGSSTAAESMSKVAFKDDGTIVALFNKRFENADNRFASAIYYTISDDEGQTWTEPQFIHSEASQNYGRSFFTISRLADGEVGAIWLDGRFGESEKGSALFFARTENGQGFGVDTCLDKNTCECCRTEILIDKNGGIHLAYRGIQTPFGKQTRDMVYSFSKDNGKSFDTAKPISKDNWEIEGCPHTGPTLAYTGDAINALWFTGAGIPGLYFSSLGNTEEEFKGKIEMSKAGRHPQMVSIKDNSLAMVWDEVLDKEQDSGDKPMHHDHGMAMKSDSPSAYSRIVLTLFNKGRINKQIPISPESQIAYHPVICSLKNGVLTAWVNEAAGKPFISYSFIGIN
jgi:hypothetical protein